MKEAVRVSVSSEKESLRDEKDFYPSIGNLEEETIMESSESELEQILKKQLLEFKEPDLAIDDLFAKVPNDTNPDTKWKRKDILRLFVFMLEGYSNWEIADSLTVYQPDDELVSTSLLGNRISIFSSKKLEDLRKVALHVRVLNTLIQPKDSVLEKKLRMIEKTFRIPRSAIFQDLRLGMHAQVPGKRTERSVSSPEIFIPLLYEKLINGKKGEELQQLAETLLKIDPALDRRVTKSDLGSLFNRKLTEDAKRVFELRGRKRPRNVHTLGSVRDISSTQNSRTDAA